MLVVLMPFILLPQSPSSQAFPSCTDRYSSRLVTAALPLSHISSSPRAPFPQASPFRTDHYSSRLGTAAPPLSQTPNPLPTYPSYTSFPFLPPAPPSQSFLLHASHDWARSAHSTLRTECLDLASRALRLEGIILPSPDPQDDFVWGLDRVQGSFRIMVAAHDIIGISLLKPEQLAQLYIASFPYLPAWAEIVAHLPRADS